MDSAIEAVTSSAWMGFLVIIVALMLFFNLITQVWTNWQMMKKPKTEEGQVIKTCIDDINVKIDEDRRKLDAHDRAIESIDEGMVVLMQACRALLNHDLHNGNGDELRAVCASMDNYLIRKSRAQEQ